MSAVSLAEDAAAGVPLRIGAVSAVLRDVLANGLIRYSAMTGIGDVNITVLSPERVAIGADEPSQINLFLYRISPRSNRTHETTCRWQRMVQRWQQELDARPTPEVERCRRVREKHAPLGNREPVRARVPAHAAS